MESDLIPDTPDHAELSERERIVSRSALAPHLDASGVSWGVVIAGSLVNTVLAWLLILVIQQEVLWILWVFLLLPLAAPIGWSIGSRMVRRRHGVAPSSTNQPLALKNLENRAVIWSLPLELGILALAAFTPVWIALPTTFAASFVVFGGIWTAYARKAREIGARIA
jgi:hypothetical protein